MFLRISNLLEKTSSLSHSIVSYSIDHLGRFSYFSLLEFQRIAGRDKKAFLRDQCKEIEENNRMGKTRDLFKKIRDTKGTFHVKMGSIKDRNGMDLTEAEDIEEVARIHRRTVQKGSSRPG